VDIQETINACLPVVVVGKEVNDPMFAIFGGDSSWALSVMCPWTISGPEGEYHWDGDSVEHASDLLVGATLIRVDIRDDLVDPVFLFNNRLQLAVHADTDLDPWTLRLPDMEFVVVGLAR
jgi:hypothetical protein